MRKLTGIVLLLLVPLAINAQNPFEFKGRFFGHFGAGYRAPLKKYFKGQLLDDMLSLKNNSVSIDVTHYYFVWKNWGVFWNMQFDPSRPEHRPKSDLQRFVRYENDYYFSNKGGWLSPANIDERMVWGVTYRFEKERWRIFSSLGAGLSEFEAVEDFKDLKEKNSNVYHKAELIRIGGSDDTKIETNFLTAASLLCGYRLNKRFTAALNVKLARFKPNFEYRLERTNQFTGEKFIEDTYNYKRSTVDLTASAGIMFTPSIDKRGRGKN
ncbi:hypothetical protein [Niabella aquatica]